MNKKAQNILLFIFLVLIAHSIDSIKSTKIEDITKSKKHYAGSLLELIKASDILTESEFDSKTKNEPKISNFINKRSLDKVFLSTKTKTGETEIIVHTPFNKIKETNRMRHRGLVILFVFLTCYMVIRLGYNCLKKINKFFAKGLKLLSSQIFLLFFCLSMLIFLYVYGAFDEVYINWEYLINMIASVLLYWISFNIILLLVSLFVNHRWKVLEKEATNFEFLKKQITTGQNKQEAKDCFEFLILKRYFFVPLFPVLKSVSLRKDLEFSYYLERCLLQQFKQFFKLSITCWFCCIFSLMFLNVYIANATTLSKTIFLMLVPLVGVVFVLAVYIYCKVVYRRIVPKITEQNMTNYRDVDYSSKDIIESLGYPLYLDKVIEDTHAVAKASQKTCSIHE